MSRVSSARLTVWPRSVRVASPLAKPSRMEIA
jgi:hypothetical protein